MMGIASHVAGEALILTRIMSGAGDIAIAQDFAGNAGVVAASLSSRASSR